MEGVGIECASPPGKVVVSGSKDAGVGLSPNGPLQPSGLQGSRLLGRRAAAALARGSAAKR
jgi:hypothetical protein